MNTVSTAQGVQNILAFLTLMGFGVFSLLIFVFFCYMHGIKTRGQKMLQIMERMDKRQAEQWEQLREESIRG